MTSFHLKNDSECSFKVWAPKLNRLSVSPTSGGELELTEMNANTFEGQLTIGKFPFPYYLNTGAEKKYPDPKSTFFPDGVHGPSEIDYSTFNWGDDLWSGIPTQDLIIYELHVGTFSADGTFRGCLQQLDYLVELGVNAIELMPLAQCPGRWNWGYDSVGLWAVNHNYGRPNDLKMLIDQCHSRGISVIHDVVYNHVGPEGNYLSVFGNYFSKKHGTPWGSAFDFDGPNQVQAREFVIENALFWLDEYHFDGLRLDAIHYMFDQNEYSIQQEICDRVRDYESGQCRAIHLIGEANIYDHDLIVETKNDRHLYSAIWADDLMHAIYSVGQVGEHLTPRTYNGADDVCEALTHGYLYQGPKMKRVNEADRQATHGEFNDRLYLESLIVALQTHDSVGNHPQGKRMHQLLTADFQKAAAPLVLLYPAIPMIFMGEEFATASPFMFFADFIEERLRKAVDLGRTKEFPQHDWTGSLKPSDERAFWDCKLEIPNAENEMLNWYQQLLWQRKTWKRDGLLSAGNLKVRCDAASDLFCYEYTHEDQTVFVASRLCQTDKQDLKRVQIQGSGIEVLWDSRNRDPDSRSSLPTEFQANQAIIGTGSIELHVVET